MSHVSAVLLPHLASEHRSFHEILCTKLCVGNSDECTVAILLRSDVHQGDLPGEIGHSSITSDVSSYNSISAAARAVYDYCGKGLRSPGWAQVGMFLDPKP